MSKMLIDIFLMVNEGSIFKSVDIEAAEFKVSDLRIENGVLSFTKQLGLTEKNEQGEDILVKRVTEHPEFLMEDEVFLLVVKNRQVFPKMRDEDEEKLFNGTYRESEEEEEDVEG